MAPFTLHTKLVEPSDEVFTTSMVTVSPGEGFSGITRISKDESSRGMVWAATSAGKRKKAKRKRRVTINSLYSLKK
jgi:hypothetical protein